MSGITEQSVAAAVSEQRAAAAARELEQHCRTIAKEVLEGKVVPVLGAGVNVCEREESAEWGPTDLPSAAELAKHLADHSAYEPELYRRTGPGPHEYEPVFDLVRVAQYIEVAKGTLPLHEALHEVFTRGYRPTVVHRFLARLAKVVPSDYPLLMLTTNYDDALEQALREVDVAYDVVTYVTDYPERTRGYFTHSSWQPGDEDESKPVPISRAKSYTNLLEARPAIVKIHGATRRMRTVDEDNYVSTEDDHIDFLVHKDLTRSLPVAVAERLPRSHFLFLGYALKDWNLRVLLRKIWREQRRTAKSWSVRLDADEIEHHWWEKQDVSTLHHPLTKYILALRGACLGGFIDSFYSGPDESPQAPESPRTLRGTEVQALFERLSEEDTWETVSRAVPAEHARALLDDRLAATLPDALLEEIRKRVHTHSAPRADD
jgi:SIR2-like domain